MSEYYRNPRYHPKPGSENKPFKIPSEVTGAGKGRLEMTTSCTTRRIDLKIYLLSQHPELKYTECWQLLFLSGRICGDFIPSSLFVCYFLKTNGISIYKSRKDNKSKVCMYTYLTKSSPPPTHPTALLAICSCLVWLYSFELCWS